MARLFLFTLCLWAAWAPLSCAQEAEKEVPEAIEVEDLHPDAAIEDRLRGILAALGRDHVEVSVASGVVTFGGRVPDAAANAQVVEIAERLSGVVAVRNEMTAAGELAEQLNPALARFGARLDRVIAGLPLLLLAAAVFAVFVGLGYLAARAPLWNRLAPNAFIAGIYRQAVRVVFGLVGLVLALDLAGAAALLGTILGAAGIIGLAIGFAVRDTVENFVASIMLSLRQPFRPNDLVEIDGDSGQVIRLTSRATILLSLDGNHIRIPNAVVFKGRIVNYTRNPSRRFAFDIGIDPDSNLEATRLLAQNTLEELPFVLADPEPLVWIENLTESGAVLRVTGWVDQITTGFVTARGDAIRLVKAAIEAAGVAIPDTTYRIRLENATTGAAAAQAPAAPKEPRPHLAPTPEPEPQRSRRSEENALTPLVAAERQEKEDLLRGDAPQE